MNFNGLRGLALENSFEKKMYCFSLIIVVIDRMGSSWKGFGEYFEQRRFELPSCLKLVIEVLRIGLRQAFNCLLCVYQGKNCCHLNQALEENHFYESCVEL